MEGPNTAQWPLKRLLQPWPMHYRRKLMWNTICTWKSTFRNEKSLNEVLLSLTQRETSRILEESLEWKLCARMEPDKQETFSLMRDNDGWTTAEERFFSNDVFLEKRAYKKISNKPMKKKINHSAVKNDATVHVLVDSEVCSLLFLCSNDLTGDPGHGSIVFSEQQNSL